VGVEEGFRKYFNLGSSCAMSKTTNHQIFRYSDNLTMISVAKIFGSENNKLYFSNPDFFELGSVLCLQPHIPKETFWLL
jgi:hypothetical protein